MKIRDTSLLRRGQMWFLENCPFIDYNNEEDVHVIKKNRPVIIVSTDKANPFSSVVNIIPITHRDAVRLPSQTRFIYNNESNISLAEQIYTVPFFLFKNAKYLGTVSDEVMNSINNNLRSQLDLFEKEDKDINELMNMIKSLIKSYKKDTNSEAKSAARIIKEELSSLFDTNNNEEKNDTIESIVKDNEDEDEETKSNKAKKVYTKLTPEYMKQFIKDSRELSTDDMMKKYKLTNIKQISSNRYVYKKKLQELDSTP